MRTEEDIVLLADDNVNLCRSAVAAFNRERIDARIASDAGLAFKFFRMYAHRRVLFVVDLWSTSFIGAAGLFSYRLLQAKRTMLSLAWTDRKITLQLREEAWARGALDVVSKQDLETLVSYVKGTPAWSLLGGSPYDDLTEMYTRRGFMQAAQDKLKSHLRSRSPQVSCMVMADLDLFKEINDNHTHAVGDKALKLVSKVLRKHLRDTDLLGRYGGDEFLILVSGTNELLLPSHLIARVNEDLATEYVEGKDGEKVFCSMSFGFVQFELEDISGGVLDSLERFIQTADDRLLKEKERKKQKGTESV